MSGTGIARRSLSKLTTEQVQPKRKRRPFRWLLGLIGIQCPEEKGRWLLLTNRFRLIIFLTIVFVVAGLVWFTFDYGSRPSFCSSCHFMEPYVESWRTSTHGKAGVTCMKCHSTPGPGGLVRAKISGIIQLVKEITGNIGTMPHAEIDDASCLREGCHETRLLEGKVLFKGKYTFDHTPHLNKRRLGKQLRCTSCHSQIVQGEHIKVTESTCFTCHFKQRKGVRKAEPIAGCTSCHTMPSGPIETTQGTTFDHKPFTADRKVACWKCHSDGVEGTGDVPRQVCKTCHGEKKKLEMYNDSERIHDWHVTRRKVECFQCHGEIRHGLHVKPEKNESSCNTCHSGGHGAQGQLYAGVGGMGVKNSPSKHFQSNVDCIACHETFASAHGSSIVDTNSRVANESACLSCHGSSRKGMLADWQSALADALSDAKAELASAQKACDKLADGDPARAKAEKLLEIARHNCEFISTASGVHNLSYAMDLLDKASDSASEALEIAEDALKKANRK